MSRLSYDDILTIYKYISLNFTASQIAMKMHVSESTLYRIISANIEIKSPTKFSLTYRYRDCKKLSECRKAVKQCPMDCERFQKNLCGQLCEFPFICDFCESRPFCGKERHFWNPIQVYYNRIQRLKNTRSHLSLSKNKIVAFDDWLTPFIKKKISIEAVYSQFPQSFPVSPSTVRRWIDQGHLRVRRIDLVRAVTFKAKKAYGSRRPSNQNPLLKFGHTHPHFLDYVKVHPGTSIIEMDTVHGLLSEERKLLTFYH